MALFDISHGFQLQWTTFTNDNTHQDFETSMDERALDVDLPRKLHPKSRQFRQRKRTTAS